ncbi:hypothetical protein BBBOND_0110900 [Babesia bigemina]|uniref:Uncharacterized protein n=1 Tax=Babesia bigemina TaxID=5866 RepID=A0A061D2I6_BABBI|nr:hypothetical protein BBBOND_0110900 [Babesia bigemina]CDR94793.1 hypothetical protein BBBOND_0110900 [Babesia bigemina]|eukprot:XP_012766979.1 hypothetical protein BBBOND_0110900 [Babesia bigemina]
MGWQLQRLRGLGGRGEDELYSAVPQRGSSSSRAASPPRADPHTGPPSTSPSNPAPYIIVPVALIIVVICVMIYFRIRPFHRVRNDCVDDKSHEQ